MFRAIFAFFCILCIRQINCQTDSRENVQNNDINITTISYWADEVYFKDISQQLKQILVTLESQRLNNELLTKRLDIMENLLKSQEAQIPTKDNLLNNTLKAQKLNKPKNCEEALRQNNEKEGVYQIFSQDTNLDPFFVNCVRHPETAEAWMIIQRRSTGDFNFYRNWKDYKYGFGDIFNEYWLGLERLHALTNSRPHKLWIELKDFYNLEFDANYELFAIGNENEKYALKVLGYFTGNAGDSLRYHAGNQFSTYDNSNDASTTNECARNRKGAWWFRNCQESHLNGKYYTKAEHNVGEIGMGISWYSIHGNKDSLKYAHMAIRPVDGDD